MKIELKNKCPGCDEAVEYDGTSVVAIGPGGWPVPEEKQRAIHKRCFTPYALAKRFRHK